MSDLPEPLTPPDCDLRGMPFMPVDIVRLFDSDLYALSSGDEFKAAFTLWGKAFLQVPAGSVPDDDRILAHLSGAGPRWLKVKSVVLRGWLKCSDGRLYHPVVAEKAAEAWIHRQSLRERSRKGNAKRWGRDLDCDVSGGGNSDPEGFQSVAEIDYERHDKDSPKDATAIPEGLPNQSLKDPKGQGQLRDREERKKEPLLRNGAADASLQPPIDDDMRLQAWSEGKRVIGKLTGKSPGQCGKLIGLMLRDLNDDCAVLLEIIREAEGLRPMDPAAWLVAAVRERKKPKFRNGFLQMIVNEGMPSPDPPVASNPVLEFLEKYENVQH